MANYVTNNFTITGKLVDIQHFVIFCFLYTRDHEWEFDFNKIIISPDSIENCPSQYILSDDCTIYQRDENRPWFNWYAWSVDNWGTKWNAFDTHFESGIVEYDDGSAMINFSFLTAWDAPQGIIYKIIENFPKLDISYAYLEDGFDFCGSYTSKDGFREVVNYKNNHDEFVNLCVGSGFWDEEYFAEIDEYMFNRI